MSLGGVEPQTGVQPVLFVQRRRFCPDDTVIYVNGDLPGLTADLAVFHIDLV